MNMYTRTLFLLGVWFGVGWTAIYHGVKDFYGITEIDWYLFLVFIVLFFVTYTPIVLILEKRYKIVRR